MAAPARVEHDPKEHIQLGQAWEDPTWEISGCAGHLITHICFYVLLVPELSFTSDLLLSIVSITINIQFPFCFALISFNYIPTTLALRLFYPWSNFDPGIISIFFSPKTHFWGPFHQFYFWYIQEKVHNGLFWKENFQTLLRSKVTVSKFLFLKCSYLIGQGSDFYLQ